MSHAHPPHEAKAHRADQLVTSNHAGFQVILPQAENIMEILSSESFIARMGICDETLRNWKQTGKLRNGVHYLQIGLKATYPWPHAYIMLMKDMQEQSGSESNEKQNSIVTNTVSRKANIGPPKTSKIDRQKERQPKIKLGYKPQ